VSCSSTFSLPSSRSLSSCVSLDYSHAFFCCVCASSHPFSRAALSCRLCEITRCLYPRGPEAFRIATISFFTLAVAAISSANQATYAGSTPKGPEGSKVFRGRVATGARLEADVHALKGYRNPKTQLRWAYAVVARAASSSLSPIQGAPVAAPPSVLAAGPAWLLPSAPPHDTSDCSLCAPQRGCAFWALRTQGAWLRSAKTTRSPDFTHLAQPVTGMNTRRSRQGGGTPASKDRNKERNKEAKGGRRGWDAPPV